LKKAYCAPFHSVAFQSKLSKLLKALSRDTANCRARSPHLFATTYSGSYFGISQAIEADAFYAALIAARKDRAISEDAQRWEIIALGRPYVRCRCVCGSSTLCDERGLRRIGRRRASRTGDEPCRKIAKSLSVLIPPR
jgi:hypothetical protein